jgi:hypothetical protein
MDHQVMDVTENGNPQRRPDGGGFPGGYGITYEGGNGDSLENAVVVRGARFDLAGTIAVFAWLTATYGQLNVDWRLKLQSHGRFGNREIDTLVLDIKNRGEKTVFFDVTDSFGKFPEYGVGDDEGEPFSLEPRAGTDGAVCPECTLESYCTLPADHEGAHECAMRHRW